jgi:RNA polymerase sigma-70 factor (ECF subfamily)
MELHSDTYYVHRIQAGDVSALACLLDRYSRPVHSLIFKLVRNREDAEELAQDVFVKVFRHAASFKGDSSFSTWIYRIAYNTAISAVRKKKPEFPAIDEAMIDNVSEEMTPVAFSTDDADRRIDLLDGALAKLPPDEQAIILLFYMQEKSIEEIAAITGLSTSNVKTRLHRIRKKLFVILTNMEN